MSRDSNRGDTVSTPWRHRGDTVATPWRHHGDTGYTTVYMGLEYTNEPIFTDHPGSPGQFHRGTPSPEPAQWDLGFNLERGQTSLPSAPLLLYICLRERFPAMHTRIPWVREGRIEIMYFSIVLVSVLCQEILAEDDARVFYTVPGRLGSVTTSTVKSLNASAKYFGLVGAVLIVSAASIQGR